jgi:hypothetical protein
MGVNEHVAEQAIIARKGTEAKAGAVADGHVYATSSQCRSRRRTAFDEPAGLFWVRTACEIAPVPGRMRLDDLEIREVRKERERTERAAHLELRLRRQGKPELAERRNPSCAVAYHP